MNADATKPTPLAESEVTILAVDDRPANLIALKRVLASVPARVVTAMSGEEALSASLQHRSVVRTVAAESDANDRHSQQEWTSVSSASAPQRWQRAGSPPRAVATSRARRGRVSSPA